MLDKPASLWLSTQLADLVDASGALDPQKVANAVEAGRRAGLAPAQIPGATNTLQGCMTGAPAVPIREQFIEAFSPRR